MDQVSVVRSPASPLRLTEHPLQRCGAWAVATLAGRERVEDVTDEQLEGVIKRIVDDAVESATASPDIGAYDWWKILFALYPNSKLTHNKRSKDRAVLSREANQLFLPDDAEGPGRACTFCGQRCTTLWSKMTLRVFPPRCGHLEYRMMVIRRQGVPRGDEVVSAGVQGGRRRVVPV